LGHHARALEKAKSASGSSPKISRNLWMVDPATDGSLCQSRFKESGCRNTEAVLRDPSAWLEAVHPDDRVRVRTAKQGSRAAELRMRIPH